MNNPPIKIFFLVFNKFPLIILLFILSHVVNVNAQDVVKDYVLGPTDIIKVTVYEQPDLTLTAQITASGQIVMPLIGAITVQGLTAIQAEAKIADALRKGGYVKSPQVTVTVQEFRSQQVAVLGYVKKSDKYSIDATSTIIDILARAGGVTEEAGDVITIVKNLKGKKSIHKVNLSSFYTGDLSQNIEITAGDLILIPKMETYYIYGEVGKPGAYRLERNMTLVQALSVGGGLTDRGTQKGILIKRQKGNGEIEELQADLNDRLAPNDVIYVRESLF